MSSGGLRVFQEELHCFCQCCIEIGPKVWCNALPLRGERVALLQVSPVVDNFDFLLFRKSLGFGFSLEKPALSLFILRKLNAPLVTRMRGWRDCRLLHGDRVTRL